MLPRPTLPADDVAPPEAVAIAAAGRSDECGAVGTAVVGWRRTPLAHRVANMTTAALDRYEGTLSDGRTWSAVAKVLQPASASPIFAMVPEAFRAQVLSDLDWLDEPRVYESAVGSRLPDGLRMPAVHLVEREPADHPERITIWMEDVDDHGAWDLERYARVASLLGAMSGGLPAGPDGDALGLGGRDLRRLFHGKVTHLDLAVQADDAFWRAPRVANVVDARHRADLYRCAELVPRLLDAATSLPHGVCHGDATPDNLLSPRPDEFVAIDWSYGHTGPIGSDLGQLLAGRFESGAADPDDVAAIATAVLDGFCDGLAASGSDATRADVRCAFAAHLATRSAFSALVVDHRPDLDDDELTELTRRRAAVARYAIDLVTDVAGERAAGPV